MIVYRALIKYNNEMCNVGQFATEQLCREWVFEDNQPWSQKFEGNNILKDGYSYEIISLETEENL